jgi:prevent-host-death family protein
MNMKTMTASVASKEFGRYLDAAQREPVIVTKKNRPVAVTVSFQDWEELTTLRIERGLAQGLDDIENGRFEEVNDASTAARIARFKDRNTSAA